jgi:Lrp/AsnC family transcriptional regulator for asnA, asnC and gidA
MSLLPSVKLDETDYQIVSQLRKDGRMSYRAIAQELDLTEATIRGRVRRLEEGNAMKVVAVTDFEAAGYGLLLSVGVQVEDRSPVEVAEDLAKVPEVFSVTVVVGTHDIEILAVTENEDTLCELLSRTLADLPGVRRLTPSLAMDVLKNQSSWVPFHD